MLGVAHDTIRRAIRAGELAAVRVGPEKTGVRIHRDELLAYIKRLAEAEQPGAGG